MRIYITPTTKERPRFNASTGRAFTTNKTREFEEALKWTLAVLGITATAGMTDAYWEEYGDDFVDYATQNGATQTEVAEWQMKLCEGILDKGSQVWTKFKAWLFK